MSATARRLVPLALLLTLAACAKKPDPDSPLAFVPADTPYVMANLEPVSQPVLDQWTSMSREVWPISLEMYRRMLDKVEQQDSAGVKAARAVLEEVATHLAANTPEKLGFKGNTHAAVYGIGLLPVLRLQLADPEALRATVARVEAKAGAKLPVANLGGLDYWSVSVEKAQLLFAISGKQLVLSVAPAAISDDLRKQLLGVTRPAKTLDPEVLVALNQRHGYTPQGSGYVDIVRLMDFYTNEADPVRRELVKALPAEAMPAVDPVCKTELGQIAGHFPRISLGYTELDTKRMTLHAQLDMDATLARDFTAAWTAAPGTGGKAEGLLDISLSLPVLKQKAFWLKQAKAVTDKPYACPDLADLNDAFANLKKSLDTTIPPPASDLTGLRVSLSKLEFKSEKEAPDYAGKLLVALTNPAGAVAMGQLALAPLKDLKLLPDGKPVALPADLAPAQLPPMFAAMNNSALALSAGAGEEAGLGAYLEAPAANKVVFLRTYFSGSLYAQFGSMMEKFAVFLPEEQRADMASQKKMFELYQKWIDHAEFTLTATDQGLVFVEVIQTR